MAKKIYHDKARVTRGNEEPQDLGFGTVVSQESRERLLNQDGSFNVYRTGLSFLTSLSPYHSLLTMSWTKFITLIVTAYVALNFLFGSAFYLCGTGALAGETHGDISSAFLRSLFFSVQTMSTIGYGHIYPVGITANIIVAIESLMGLLLFAFAAGLLFARFSRPTAKILFSNSAIIAPYRDITAFEFRIANARKNQIIELVAEVLFTRFEANGEELVRKFYPLKLERTKVVFFPLHWTIVHPIDESSPLFGLTPENMVEIGAEFLILLSGIDETFSQIVHSRSSYKAEEILWNMRFVSIFKMAETGRLTADISRIHLIEETLIEPPIAPADESTAVV